MMRSLSDSIMKTLISVERNFIHKGSRSHLTIQSVGKEILPFIDSTFSTLKVGNARLLVGDSWRVVLPY